MPDFTLLWQLTPVVDTVNCGQGHNGCTTTYKYNISPGQGGWSVIRPRWGTGRMIQRGTGYMCTYPTNQPSPSFWTKTLTRLTYIAPDGTEMEFVDQQTGGVPQPASNGSSYDRGTVFVSHDGSSAVFTASSSISDPLNCGGGDTGASGVLVTRDGIKHTFVNGYEIQIEDSNGNQISIGLNSLTDQLGRAYTIVTSNQCDELRLPDYATTGKVTKVCYDIQDNLLRSDQSLQTTQSLWNVVGSSVPLNANNTQSLQRLIKEIDLPDGSSYTFRYDSYGNVARVVLPTGGAVEYDYTSVVSSSTASSSVTVANLARSLVERREYLHIADSTASRVTQYSGGTVTDYDGQNHLFLETIHTFESINSSRRNYSESGSTRHLGYGFEVNRLHLTIESSRLQ